MILGMSRFKVANGCMKSEPASGHALRASSSAAVLSVFWPAFCAEIGVAGPAADVAETVHLCADDGRSASSSAASKGAAPV